MAKKLSVSAKLECVEEEHKEEDLKAICLNPDCEQNPFLCALCLT
jgi:hypothetical protein